MTRPSASRCRPSRLPRRRSLEDKQKIPVSVTAVSRDTIENAGIHIVSEAAIFAPNTFFTEWTARKLSNARFRGISSSPNNPGITTYIDGVPQINANSSSIELLDVDQIEFVRGPQSALFGRNTLGGLVNITSSRPSLAKWTGTFSVPFGNYGVVGGSRRRVGPGRRGQGSLGVSFAQVDRDGFTVNDVTGNDIDSRSAFSAKAQVLWTPNSDWEARVIVTGERARDGDYALNDVGGAARQSVSRGARFRRLRQPRRLRHDDPGAACRRTGRLLEHDRLRELEDPGRDRPRLHAAPAPDARQHGEGLPVHAGGALRVGGQRGRSSCRDSARLRWQAGVFLFTQAYEQDAINSYAPFLFAPFPVSQHSPLPSSTTSASASSGRDRHVQRSARSDRRRALRLRGQERDARELLRAGDRAAHLGGRRRELLERLAAGVARLPAAARTQTLYATVGGGYKAGGFNPASPAGNEAYGEEHTWHFEGGVEDVVGQRPHSTNAAVFYIDWTTCS